METLPAWGQDRVSVISIALPLICAACHSRLCALYNQLNKWENRCSGHSASDVWRCCRRWPARAPLVTGGCGLMWWLQMLQTLYNTCIHTPSPIVPEGIEGAAVSPSVARMRRSASLSEATHSSCFGFNPVLPAVQKQAVISANKRDKAVLMFPPSPSSTCYWAGTSSCLATKARRFFSYPFESERLQWCRVFIRLLKRRIAIIRINL